MIEPIGWCKVYDPQRDEEVTMWVTRRLTDKEVEALEKRAQSADK